MKMHDYGIMRRLFLLVLAAVAAVTLQAKPVLPKVFSDNMVLQQNREAAFWGTASKNAKVTVKGSWDRKAVAVTTADSDGKWSLRLQTPSAGGPYTVTVSDGEKIEFSNVLIGEVWLCSGQSNMEMPMRGFRSQLVEDVTDCIVTASPDRPIRIFNVGRGPAIVPQQDLISGSWLVHDPSSVAGCSAVAYFFADLVQRVTGVPVGLLISDYGGTPIRSWMDRQTLAANSDEDLSFLESGDESKAHKLAPTCLFNAMIAPLIPFTIKGIIWYQGCTDRERPEAYKTLQPAYARMMRDYWNDPDMPFYFTQIAPYSYSDSEGTIAAVFREAQAATLKTIPHSGMAVTMDVGDEGCIHPSKKKPVGHRLAYLALVNDYGVGGIDPDAPVYESLEVKDGKAVITMSKGRGSLGIAPYGRNIARTTVDGREIVCFEIAGADRVFHPADEAYIDKPNIISVSAAAVPEPVAVRYCFHNYTEGVMFNAFGIPVPSFRTDDWEIE